MHKKALVTWIELRQRETKKRCVKGRLIAVRSVGIYFSAYSGLVKGKPLARLWVMSCPRNMGRRLERGSQKPGLAPAMN